MPGSHRAETRSGRNCAQLSSRSSCWRRSRALPSASPPRRNRIRPPTETCRHRGCAPRASERSRTSPTETGESSASSRAARRCLCRTSITGTFATGQMAVRVDIIEREGDGIARLQLFAPVGMYLPAGVELTVDQGEPHQARLIAGASPTPASRAPWQTRRCLRKWLSGQTLRLEFVDSSLLTLTTSLPLGQFASVHKGAPAQTFEQDIDE